MIRWLNRTVFKRLIIMNSSVYVAGHQGLVGSALVDGLKSRGEQSLVLRTRQELDLLEQEQVRNFFAEQRPSSVFLAAAKVGGIHANNTYPAEFIYENLMIQSNIIDAAYHNGVDRLLFLGSSCIYPKFAPQPMHEEHLLTGPLEPTNEPYAVAKIAGIKMCQSYNRQYGTRYLALMPTNLYGSGDNFDLENSHVLPALIRRFHDAKEQGAESVVIWGTGTPRREFLFVDDMAEASLFLMDMPDIKFLELVNDAVTPLVNIGFGSDVSISELAELIREIVGYSGSLEFDTSRPDGTPQKLLDVSRMKSLGWQAGTTLADGIEKTYNWFLDHQVDYRTGDVGGAH